MRDEFSAPTKELLAKRAGYQCSFPGCNRITIGPHLDPSKAINMGVAAHIKAASSGGPRYDSSIRADVRSSAGNGIWLCHFCSNLIDRDDSKYTVEVLLQWKSQAEDAAAKALTMRRKFQDPVDSKCQRAEKLMPELLAEMRQDLLDYPFRRIVVLLGRNWDGYNRTGREFEYYFETHPDLTNMVEILVSLGLLERLRPSLIGPFQITETFAEWLSETSVAV